MPPQGGGKRACSSSSLPGGAAACVDCRDDSCIGLSEKGFEEEGAFTGFNHPGILFLIDCQLIICFKKP